MKVALDTNFIAYAEGINGDEKRQVALNTLNRLCNDDVVIPVQVLGELFNVLVRKAGRSAAEAQMALSQWRQSFTTADITADIMDTASMIAMRHRLSIWDSVILAVASSAGCDALISEDMHHGFTYGSVSICNPFISELGSAFGGPVS
ncbi:MAG: PIN domain-containing protein [Mesorhizobium sp.]|nr:PIN domain-containing protein [Mesorhizobium sp.]